VNVASSILPAFSGLDGYRALRRRDGVWDAAKEALCARHGLDARSFGRFPTGTHVVFGSEYLVIKIFCPLWPEDFAAERAALSTVTGLPVPGMIAEGELEGWPYIVMTRLPGIQVKLLWNGFDDRTRRSVLEQLGSLISGMQRLPTAPGLEVDWNDFIRRGVEGAQAHHAPTDPHWAEWISGRLEGFTEPPFDPVFLHADITDEHLLLSEVDGRWCVTGLIDFGDAMTGHPLYELVAPFCCLCFGRRGMAETLVEATGHSLDAGVEERLVTYCLLHRFGTLHSFLERFSVPDGPSFVEALFHRFA
jgi:hygromycin-B 7''-O-kinase